MRYRDFHTEDFVEDAKFRKWVLEPDPEVTFFWEKWLLRHPEKERVIEEAREILLLLKSDEILLEDERKVLLWQKIQRTIDSPARVLPLDPAPASTRAGKRWFWAAASVAVLLAVVISLWPQDGNRSGTNVQTVAMVTKQNPAGQKSKVFLPDGTVVYLNSESKLEYSQTFAADSRQVYLTGEAFFEVSRDTLRPFTVYAGGLATTALGTSFNVRAFGELPSEVTLITGKVEVLNSSSLNRVILNPGDQVKMAGTDQLVRSRVDVKGDILWKDGILFFQETPFDEVVVALERWYGVKVKLVDPPSQLGACSGKFDNEYLSNVLNTIGYSLGFTYEIEDNEVNIRFNQKRL